MLFAVLTKGKVDPAKVDRPESGRFIMLNGEVIIPVSIADTEEERIVGLSGTLSLPTGTGKLFVFETSAFHGFWMKDMAYPIDIIWIDDSMRVVGSALFVTPESYPDVWYPPSPVKYVLEIAAGQAQELGITEGLKFSLE